MTLNHRYHIVKKLGEGATGEVFLVDDAVHGNTRHAMKLLHRLTLSETFRNEVSALLTLYHPNLVRIFDFGTIRHADSPTLVGRHYLCVEYVEGSDILAWYQDLSRNNSHCVASVVMQILSALEYIHRAGMIHRDIKPENLLIVGTTPERPLVKLTDFGLSSLHRELSELPLRGTLEYTAPELLRGDAPDHRIDLYSLGATLFHLLEGRCPFEGTSPMELIKKILNDEPVFTGSSCTELVTFVSTLLQKDPAHRPPSAWEAALRFADAFGLRDPVSFRYLPRLVGRESELSVISGALHTLRDAPEGGTIHSILVTGPDGMGKTTLLERAEGMFQSSGVRVYRTSSGVPDLPASAISRLLDALTADILSESDTGRQLVTAYQPVVRPVHGPTGSYLNPEAELLARYVVECSRIMPFALFVDDFQSMDTISQDVVAAIARDSGRLVVIASSTDPDLVLAPETTVLELAELALADVRSLTQQTFGGEGHATAAIAEKLFALYGGTPAVVAEAMRRLAADLPTPREAPSAEDVAGRIAGLPQSLDQFLLQRYAALAREDQLTLGILAFCAFPARVDIVSRVLPFHPDRTYHALRTLEGAGLVAFTHGSSRVSVRQARLTPLIRAASGGARADIHASLAKALEEVTPRSLTDMQELAFQYNEAHQPAQARTWYAHAAVAAQDNAAYALAAELYQHAIACAEAAGEFVQMPSLEVRLAHAFFQAGMFRECIELASRLQHHPGIAETDTALLYKSLGLSQLQLGDHSGARTNILKALSATRDQTEILRLRQELVGMDIALGNYQSARETCREQLDRALDLGDQQLLASVYTDLGIATFFEQHYDDAIRWFEHAAGIYSRLHDTTHHTNALINIGNALSAKGEVVRAIATWNDALSASSRLGTTNQHAQILNNLGIAHYRLKRYPKAIEYYSRALELARRIHSLKGIAYALSNMGEVAFAEGWYEKALRSWEESLHAYNSMDDAHGLVEANVQLGHLHIVFGNQEQATSHLDAARKALQHTSSGLLNARFSFLEGAISLTSGDALKSHASFATARRLFEEGGEIELEALSTVRLAEAEWKAGDLQGAVGMLTRVLKNCQAFPQVEAEARYLLGCIARKAPTHVPERPISLFKRGLEVVTPEPVTELSWKLALALGEEYIDRGQTARAAESLEKARRVIEYFLGHVLSPDLKNQYLAADGRGDVLKSIEVYLNE